MSRLLESAQMVDRLYGADDTQARLAGKQDFEELLGRLLEDEDVGKRQPEDEITEHLSLYFQGASGILKLQTYDLPRDSRRIAARSAGNHTMPAYDQISWVFLEDANHFRQLFRTEQKPGARWDIGEVLNDTRIFVVALYPGAKSCNYGSEQVWVQLARLGCIISRLRIVFGGRFQNVALGQTYLLKRPEHNFLELGLGDVRHLETPFDSALARFATLEERIFEISAVVTVPSQPPWEHAAALWGEFKAARDVTLWDGVELHDISSDVLIMANGHHDSSA